MRVFGIAGWSGSGKTTLLKGLIPTLIGRGLSVSSMKHAHHAFDIDVPGKDSYRHAKAGAHEVMIALPDGWVLHHPARKGMRTPLLEMVGSERFRAVLEDAHRAIGLTHYHRNR